MRKVFIAVVPALAGCGATSGSLEGVWLLFLTPQLVAECTTEITDNFPDATPADDAGDTAAQWETEVVGDATASAGFARFAKGPDGGAVMVFEGQTFSGTREKNVWTFSFEGTTNATTTVNHTDAPYVFSAAVANTSKRTMTFTQKGEHLIDGSWTFETTTDNTWTETDEWVTDDVPLLAGQMPSATYLVDNLSQPYVNRPTDRDCDDPECSLEVVEVCSRSNALAGDWTSVDPNQAFDGVEGAGQPGGFNPQ